MNLLLVSVAIGLVLYVRGASAGISAFFAGVELAFALGIFLGNNGVRVMFFAVYMFWAVQFYQVSTFIVPTEMTFFALLFSQVFLQGIALWLVFRHPGKTWFIRRTKKPQTFGENSPAAKGTTLSSDRSS